MARVISVTCTAPVNIAVIKYWGKRDEKLILPINGSISATLDQAQLRAKTTVAASDGFTEDRMWLNGQKQSVDTPRLQNVLKEIRRRARKRKESDSHVEDMLRWHIHICSENNFPTAAGLASSAAGLACLVYSLAKLFKVDGDISDIARQGSGSACRSVYGGFVEWTMGCKDDGSDSVAVQLAPETYWPQMRILILVVSAHKKHVGSTSGMQTSVETSRLLAHRAQCIVPEWMETMRRAIQDKDFTTFAEYTMRDSNQLHAVCLDTYPPVSYMTDTSRDIQRLVHSINDHFREIKVCYTFDAGPNACLYLPEENVPLIMSMVRHFFPAEENKEMFVRGPLIESIQPPKELVEKVSLQPNKGGVSYVIHTKVGPGPQVLTDPADSLINEVGYPK